ncbi:hypothetical protein Tco_1477146 [Tanacetum coccineum]
MCVDFKDLNNACPKDCYPLPERDWKVESLCGNSFKCFLDAYKGYHQIKMEKEDEEKPYGILKSTRSILPILRWGVCRIAKTKLGVKKLASKQMLNSRTCGTIKFNGSYIAKESGMGSEYLDKVLVEELKEKSINEKGNFLSYREEGNTWMTPICEYLAKEILPEDKKKARAADATITAINGKEVRMGQPLFADLADKEKLYQDNGKTIRDNPFKDGVRKCAITPQWKASHAKDEGKLDPSWGDPYEVKGLLERGLHAQRLQRK